MKLKKLDDHTRKTILKIDLQLHLQLSFVQYGFEIDEDKAPNMDDCVSHVAEKCPTKPSQSTKKT